MSDEDDYLFDKKGDPDPDVRELENVLGTARYVSPATPRVARVARVARVEGGGSAAPSRQRRKTALLLAPLALAALVLLALALRDRRPPGPSLGVTRLDGAPRLDTRTLEGQGRLGVGGWLETDQASRAEIELAQIGRVEVGPGSRVRLVVVAPNEQRLELERGFIEAHVRAVPRLFVVDTPSARATDLGCAYRLEVVPPGAPNGGVTMLRVTSGAVELAGEGRQAHVPAGAACETRPTRGPGCPYFEDATEPFKTALRSVDFDPEPSPSAFDTLLTTARVRDTLTLWQLVWRVSPEARQRVLGRVVDLVPPLPGTDLASGTPLAFQKYQDQLMKTW